jgi:Big-like domain-containing protein
MSGVYPTVPEKSGNEYTVNFGKNLAGKTITVSIKNVKDTTLYENTLDLYTETLVVTDKTAPKVKNAYLSEKDSDGGLKLYVEFDEAVDSETALKGSNYTLYNKERTKVISLKDMDLEFDVVNSRIKVSLSKSDIEDITKEVKDFGIKTELLVVNVEDVAGNEVLPQFKSIEKLETSTNKVTYTATFTSRDKLEIEFSDILSEVEEDDVTVNVYNEDETSDELSFESLVQNDGTVTTLEITLDKELKQTDVKDIKISIVNDEIENSYGADELTFIPDPKSKDIIDEIKPEIKLDSKDNKEIEVTDDVYVTIEFTEAMDKGTFSRLSFSVDDKKVESIKLNNEGTIATLKLDEPFEANEYLRVTYEQIVKDLAGNNLDQEIGDVLVDNEVE